MNEVVDEGLVTQIATTLNEHNLALLHKVVAVIGPERAQEFLQKTVETEAQGGLVLSDNSRRRTPGGVFFYLVRKGVPGNERRQIWPLPYKKKLRLQEVGKPLNRLPRRSLGMRPSYW